MEPENNMDAPKVSFADQGFQRPVYFSKSETPKIVGLVIKYSRGLIRDEKQANIVLIILTVAVVFISIYLISSSGIKEEKPSAEAVRQMQEFQRTTNFRSN